jgi:hypothetical protein
VEACLRGERSAGYTSSHQLLKACLDMADFIELHWDEIALWKRFYLNSLKITNKKHNTLIVNYILIVK